MARTLDDLLNSDRDCEQPQSEAIIAGKALLGMLAMKFGQSLVAHEQGE